MHLRIILLVVAALVLTAFNKKKEKPISTTGNTVSQNLIIITIDGFRWQEIFNGADSTILNKTPADTALTNLLYWHSSYTERRKMLLPFMWNVIAAKGQLLGNRAFGNQMNVANFWAMSYPGYNEIFTGTTDFTIFSNLPRINSNKNVLSYLNTKNEFNGKIAVFSSWNLLPYILNQEESNIYMNAGYQQIGSQDTTINEKKINYLQNTKGKYRNTRNDALTFIAAKEYLEKNNPSILYIGLGECDEYAHSNKYDMYLEKAKQADQLIGNLWYWLQTNKQYKDNTTMLITTDHGRGQNSNSWDSHGFINKGSSQTWLAAIGPGINALGELKVEQQIYSKQIAQTIANIVGENFPGKQKHAISFK
jgi:hypothetical protein